MSRPVSEVDIYRTAALLVRQHGDAAFLFAAQTIEAQKLSREWTAAFEKRGRKQSQNHTKCWLDAWLVLIRVNGSRPALCST